MQHILIHPRPLRAVVAGLAIATATAAGVTAEAETITGTTRVSVGTSRMEADGLSFQPSMSSDGRYIAFTSRAQNLVPESDPGADVFVRDTVTGVTTLVSATASSPGNGRSHMPTITSDGRYVGFVSEADNLVPNDTNGAPDAFVKHLVTGSVRRVSLDEQGKQIPEGAHAAQLSADGGSLIFNTAATLDSDDIHTGSDIYHRFLATGAVELVSHGFDPHDRGLEGAGGWRAVVSADGRYVAYRAYSQGPGAPATVWLRDVVDDESSDLIESGFEGSRDAARAVAISADGSYVAFVTDAYGIAGDVEEDDDVYLFDIATSEYNRITPTDGAPFDVSTATSVSLSGDGRVVVYQGGQDEETLQMWAHDRATGMTTKVTDGSTDPRFDGGGSSAVGSDGAQLAFVSDSPEVPHDTNGVHDIFLRTMPECTLIGTAGNDVLTGTSGPDVICGMDGDDVIKGQGDDDTIVGGLGVDTVDYTDATSAIAANLRTGVATGQGTDALMTIENIDGSRYADRLDGDGDANVLAGRAGDDILAGNGGDDRLWGGEGRDSTDTVGTSPAPPPTTSGTSSATVTGISEKVTSIGDPDSTGTVKEISGMVVSEQSTGTTKVLWGVNDQGTPAQVFAFIDRAGKKLIHAATLEGLGNGAQFEEISKCTLPNGKPGLMIGRIGNGYSSFHRIPEPAVTIPGATADPGPVESRVPSSAVETFTFDAVVNDHEAFFMDPVTGDLFLIEKQQSSARPATARVWRIPAAKLVSGGAQGLELSLVGRITVNVSSTNNGAPTAADISDDGTKIMVGNYQEMMIWNRDPARQTVASLLTTTPDADLRRHIPATAAESLGTESLAFDAGSVPAKVYSMSEANGGDSSLKYASLVYQR